MGLPDNQHRKQKDLGLLHLFQLKDPAREHMGLKGGYGNNSARQAGCLEVCGALCAARANVRLVNKACWGSSGTSLPGSQPSP